MSVLFALLSAFCNGSTTLLQRIASVSSPKGMPVPRLAWHLVRQPLWLLGLAFMAGTFVFSAVALYFGSLAVVQPFLVTELIFTVALRQWWLHDEIARRSWLAAVLICGGLAGFLLIAQPHEGVRVPSAGAWAAAVAWRAVAVGLLLLLGRRTTPVVRATLTGCAAGLVWSIDAGFVKRATEVLSRHGWAGLLGHWSLYALVVTGAIGMLLLQMALHAGPLTASQPAILITDPLASIVLGVELFGEHLSGGAVAVTVGVLMLGVMAAGVVLLSLWAPPVAAASEGLGGRRPL
ncbi:MAG TPA: DMT family transporter [Acidimicrobiales bacterium]|nr:DMT family transporter [Acidimicrobiales bacterium]